MIWSKEIRKSDIRQKKHICSQFERNRRWKYRLDQLFISIHAILVLIILFASHFQSSTVILYYYHHCYYYYEYCVEERRIFCWHFFSTSARMMLLLLLCYSVKYTSRISCCFHRMLLIFVLTHSFERNHRQCKCAQLSNEHSTVFCLLANLYPQQRYNGWKIRLKCLVIFGYSRLWDAMAIIWTLLVLACPTSIFI